MPTTPAENKRLRKIRLNLKQKEANYANKSYNSPIQKKEMEDTIKRLKEEKAELEAKKAVKTSKEDGNAPIKELMGGEPAEPQYKFPESLEEVEAMTQEELKIAGREAKKAGNKEMFKNLGFFYKKKFGKSAQPAEPQLTQEEQEARAKDIAKREKFEKAKELIKEKVEERQGNRKLFIDNVRKVLQEKKAFRQTPEGKLQTQAERTVRRGVALQKFDITDEGVLFEDKEGKQTRRPANEVVADSMVDRDIQSLTEKVEPISKGVKADAFTTDALKSRLEGERQSRKEQYMREFAADSTTLKDMVGLAQLNPAEQLQSTPIATRTINALAQSYAALTEARAGVQENLQEKMRKEGKTKEEIEEFTNPEIESGLTALSAHNNYLATEGFLKLFKNSIKKEKFLQQYRNGGQVWNEVSLNSKVLKPEDINLALVGTGRDLEAEKASQFQKNLASGNFEEKFQKSGYTPTFIVDGVVSATTYYEDFAQEYQKGVKNGIPPKQYWMRTETAELFEVSNEFPFSTHKQTTDPTLVPLNPNQQVGYGNGFGGLASVIKQDFGMGVVYIAHNNPQKRKGKIVFDESKYISGSAISEKVVDNRATDASGKLLNSEFLTIQSNPDDLLASGEDLTFQSYEDFAGQPIGDFVADTQRDPNFQSVRRQRFTTAEMGITKLPDPSTKTTFGSSTEEAYIQKDFTTPAGIVKGDVFFRKATSFQGLRVNYEYKELRERQRKEQYLASNFGLGIQKYKTIDPAVQFKIKTSMP